MYTVEVYAGVRRAVLIEGKSRPPVARGVRAGAEDSQEDAGVFSAPGVPAAAANTAAEVGPWLGMIGAILDRERLRSELPWLIPRRMPEHKLVLEPVRCAA